MLMLSDEANNPLLIGKGGSVRDKRKASLSSIEYVRDERW